MNERPSHLGHRARLRDRLVKLGCEGMAEHELLEQLLAIAIPRVDTKRTAWALIRRFGSLARVLDAPADQLLEVIGIGPAAVGSLKIVKAVASAYLGEQLQTKDVLSSPQSVFDYCRMAFAGEGDETAHALLLDAGNRLKRTVLLSRGTVDQAEVHPRRVVEEAIAARAKGAILVHNHPSGRPEPSGADDRITRDVGAALTTIDVRLLDHVIVGEGAPYSYRQSGRL